MVVKLIHSLTNKEIKNVLLIDDDVYQNEILYNSINSNTFAVKYNNKSDRIELEELLKNNFDKIDRLCFVFNNSIINHKQFLNSELFFTDLDIENKIVKTEFSNNLKFIIYLIKKFNISNVDYLVCDSLKNSKWIKYFDLLKKETSAIIGASNNKTGNINYGGDWLLESTNENIKNIYWSELVDNYSSTLVTSTISTSTNLSAKDFSDSDTEYIFPITIDGGSNDNPTIISIDEDIEITNKNKYFIVGSEFVKITGNRKEIVIDDIENWTGFVKNGTATSDGYSNVTVENIRIKKTKSSTIVEDSGWIAGEYFGRNTEKNSFINRCIADSSCNGSKNSGLIIGSKANRIICINSTSSGEIIGGGIFGDKCTNSLAVECSSSGKIGNKTIGSAGGIFGNDCDNTNTVRKSFSTGDIEGFLSETEDIGSGGIAGSNSFVNVVDCYTWGVIGINDTKNCGGIYGSTTSITPFKVTNNQIPKNTYTSGLVMSGNVGIGVNANDRFTYSANGEFIKDDANEILLGEPPNIFTDGRIYSNDPNNPTDPKGYVLTNNSTSLFSSTISESKIVSNLDLNNPLMYSWPITINGGSKNNPTIITFANDIILNSELKYFIFGSEYITINGNNKTVTIDGVFDWEGLVQNGTPTSFGFSNTFIKNIHMKTINNSTLCDTKGWICWDYFGNPSSLDFSYVNNCSTDSTCNSNDLDYSNGLICGISANRVICDYCSSHGTISAGGIFGLSCKNSQANNCFTTGKIGGTNNIGAGGIFASNCDNTNQANNSYTTGDIYNSFDNFGSGGICGETCSVIVKNCYSRGLIGINGGTNCGGIFGGNFGENFGENFENIDINTIGFASNCYSSGEIINGFGIGQNITQENCYVANNNWKDIEAKTYLIGTPTYKNNKLIKPIGIVWADIDSSNNSTPWIFSTFGYSPYTKILRQTYTQTIKQNDKTNKALNHKNHKYSIVSINNNLPNIINSISINNLNGEIYTTNTKDGMYLIKILQQSNYTITNFLLIVKTSQKKIKLCIELIYKKKYIVYLDDIFSSYNVKKNYKIIKKPSNGFLCINLKNKLKYTPNNYYAGKDNFSILFENIDGTSFIVKFNIRIK